MRVLGQSTKFENSPLTVGPRSDGARPRTTDDDSPLRMQTPNLGEALIPSGLSHTIPEGACIPERIEIGADPGLHFELAGPREKLFFDGKSTRAAIVTCGGLCPGLNNVIRSLFLELRYEYG